MNDATEDKMRALAAWCKERVPGQEPEHVIGCDLGAGESVVAAAVVDAQGNVRLDLAMGPDDRAQARQAAQDLAREAADKVSGPAGIRSLFPSNKPGPWRMRRSPVPLPPAPRIVQEN